MIPSNFRPDIRPFGTDRDVLISMSGTPYGVQWTGILPLVQQASPVILTMTTPTGFVQVGAVLTSPTFNFTYNGSPTGLVVSGPSGSLTGTSPFASLIFTGNFIKNTVGGSYTFTATASGTASGDTESLTIAWYQKYYFGQAVDPGIYDSSFILQLGAAPSGKSDLTVNHSGSSDFTLTSGLYSWYAFRAVGTPKFLNHDSSIGGGFTRISNTITFVNEAGFSDTYQLWRSDQHNLGACHFEVSPL